MPANGRNTSGNSRPLLLCRVRICTRLASDSRSRPLRFVGVVGAVDRRAQPVELACAGPGARRCASCISSPSCSRCVRRRSPSCERQQPRRALRDDVGEHRLRAVLLPAQAPVLELLLPAPQRSPSSSSARSVGASRPNSGDGERRAQAAFVAGRGQREQQREQFLRGFAGEQAAARPVATAGTPSAASASRTALGLRCGVRTSTAQSRGSSARGAPCRRGAWRGLRRRPAARRGSRARTARRRLRSIRRPCDRAGRLRHRHVAAPRGTSAPARARRRAGGRRRCRVRRHASRAKSMPSPIASAGIAREQRVHRRQHAGARAEVAVQRRRRADAVARACR